MELCVMFKLRRVPKNTNKWRNIILALMLALIIGTTSQTHQVQAAPPAEVVTWYMDVASPKTKVCVGETVEYKTSAHYNYQAQGTEWAIPGVKVEATSTDKSVGSFKNDTAIAGFANEDMVTASFFFTAKKPGNTTLYFEAMIDIKDRSTYISFTVPVTVIPCKFKVIATSNMSTCYPSGCIKFRGVILEGRVTADENGYYTGTAPVVWISSSVVPNCGAVNTLGISSVQMRGNLNESGQLILELDYKPVQFSDVVKCSFGSGGGNEAIKVSALKVTVPPKSNLVAVNLPQQLSGGPGGVSGSADVYVIPLDGTR
jgi:hypothetical protein